MAHKLTGNSDRASVLSQHFLTGRGVPNRLVTAYGRADGRLVLEIGPGRGALTDLLVESLVDAPAENAAPITVVEFDRDVTQGLARRYPPERVKVIQADILEFDLRDAMTADTPRHRLRLIGNLPYNISTPLIFHLLEQIEHIQDMLFMLQKEVALRLAAGPELKIMAGFR